MQRLIFIVILGIIGCGPSVQSQLKGPAELIIINGHHLEADVYINRDYAGKIAAHSRKSFPGYPPGSYAIELSRLDGDHLNTQVTLEAGKRTTTPEITGEPWDNIPELSSIKLINHLPAIIDVTFNGTPLGHVLENDSNHWGGLPAGTHELQLATRGQRYLETLTVTLPADGQHVSELHYIPTSIVLNNPTENLIKATIADVGEWSVPGNSGTTVNRILPGPYEVQIQSNEIRSRRVVIAHAGKTTQVQLESASCSARVVNNTQEIVSLSNQGHFIRQLTPGESIHLDGLPKADYTLSAQLQNSGITFNRKLALAPGITPTWELRLTEGTLQIINETPEPVRIALEGESAFALAPGMTRSISGLKVGALNGLAEGQYSGTQHDFASNISVTGVTQWKLQLEAGSLAIHNSEIDEQTVSLPEVGTLLIGPGNTAFLDGLAPGMRTLQVVRNQRVEMIQVNVLAGKRTTAELTVPRAKLNISNDTGEDVIINGPFTAPLKILKGEERSIIAQPGNFRYRAEGVHSGAVHEETLAISLKDECQWSLAPFGGSIRVVNELKESVSVAPVGRRAISMAPGEARILAPVPLGLLHVHAHAPISGNDFLFSAEIRQGSHQHWTIRKSKATLTISNQTNEPQECLLEGQLVTALPPGTEKTVHVVPGQTQALLTRGTRTRNSIALNIRLKSGQHARHLIRVQHAPTQVVNNTNKALVIYNDEWMGRSELKPGDSIYGTLPAKPDALMAESPDGQFVTAATAPSQNQVNLVNLTTQSSLYWIQNSTEQTVTILLNGSSLGTLDPGIGGAFPLPGDEKPIQFEARTKNGSRWLHASQNPASEHRGWVISPRM